MEVGLLWRSDVALVDDARIVADAPAVPANFELMEPAIPGGWREDFLYDFKATASPPRPAPRGSLRSPCSPPNTTAAARPTQLGDVDVPGKLRVLSSVKTIAS